MPLALMTQKTMTKRNEWKNEELVFLRFILYSSIGFG